MHTHKTSTFWGQGRIARTETLHAHILQWVLSEKRVRILDIFDCRFKLIIFKVLTRLGKTRNVYGVYDDNCTLLIAGCQLISVSPARWFEIKWYSETPKGRGVLVVPLLWVVISSENTLCSTCTPIFWGVYSIPTIPYIDLIILYYLLFYDMKNGIWSESCILLFFWSETHTCFFTLGWLD